MQLGEELRQWVAKEIGAFARPEQIRFTDGAAEDAQREDHAAAAAGNCDFERGVGRCYYAGRLIGTHESIGAAG